MIRHIKILNRGALLSEVMQNEDINFELPCFKGTCGKCKVRIIEGKLSEICEDERKFLTDYEIENGYRLACFTRVYSDIIMETEHKKSSVLTSGNSIGFSLNPLINKDEYAVAIDIGTTTIAINLLKGDSFDIIDTIGSVNNQIKFGADVISRIDYSISKSHSEIHNTAITQINKMINELCNKTGVGNKNIKYAVVTGNTTMLYFFSNLNPRNIAFYPFTVDTLFGNFMGNDIGLNIASGGEIYIPPCISAYAGADLVCAILSSSMIKEEKTSLLVDMGTNGEITLYDNGVIKCCSTAAGPAFEGVGLEWGTSATEGAISNVYYDKGAQRIEYKTIDNMPPIGICGSGIIDAVSVFLSLGIMDVTGKILKEGHGFKDNIRIVKEQAAFVFDNSDIYITQKDIRQIQLAKGAVAGGIGTLLTEAGLNTYDIDRFYVCGGFGTYLDTKSAVSIGLIPCGIDEKITVLGNAALSGASLIVLDKGRIKECNEIVKQCQYTELSDSPVFKEKYLKEMSF